MISFKNGDKVYCPMKSTRVLTVTSDEKLAPYSIEIRGQEVNIEFTLNGLNLPTDKTPSIFHATLENKEMLEKLYGIEFETPISFVNVKIPKPFKPTIGQEYWYLSPYTNEGYASEAYTGTYDASNALQNGVWRTENEIIMLVNSIRQTVKGSVCGF